MKKSNLVTLRDIAERTGYTVNTVSRALKHREDIAKSTIEYICSVAEDMGYINDSIASSMRTGRTGTIAVILADITNPHFAIMVREIEQYASHYEYTVFVLNTNEDKDQELQAIKTALGKKVDGFIICPCPDSQSNLEFLRKTGKPYVLVGRKVEGHPSVIQDDVKAGYLATKYMIEHYNRKRILFINAEASISCSVERYQGYRMALEEAGLPLSESLVIETPTKSCEFASVLATLEAKDITFDAILAFSDLFACEILNALSARSVRVPGDIALIGIDNLREKLSYLPILDTVGVHGIGTNAVALELLMKIINEDTAAAPSETVLDVKLFPAT